jgi:hypothetical protein
MWWKRKKKYSAIGACVEALLGRVESARSTVARRNVSACHCLQTVLFFLLVIDADKKNLDYKCFVWAYL